MRLGATGPRRLRIYDRIWRVLPVGGRATEQCSYCTDSAMDCGTQKARVVAGTVWQNESRGQLASSSGSQAFVQKSDEPMYRAHIRVSHCVLLVNRQVALLVVSP